VRDYLAVLTPGLWWTAGVSHDLWGSVGGYRLSCLYVDHGGIDRVPGWLESSSLSFYFLYISNSVRITGKKEQEYFYKALQYFRSAYAFFNLYAEQGLIILANDSEQASPGLPDCDEPRRLPQQGSPTCSPARAARPHILRHHINIS